MRPAQKDPSSHTAQGGSYHPPNYLKEYGRQGSSVDQMEGTIIMTHALSATVSSKLDPSSLTDRQQKDSRQQLVLEQ